MKNLRKSLGILMYGITLLVALIAFSIFLSVQHYHEDGPLKEDTLFEVSKGASLSLIAKKLEHENLIDDAFLFKLAAHILGKSKDLKAGEYQFEAKVSMSEIMSRLKDGKSFQRFITIPEGLTSFEIVRLLNENEKLKGELITTIPQEGSLLPETYSYDKNETRQDILERMAKTMKKILDKPTTELCPERIPQIDVPEGVAQPKPPSNTVCIPAPFETWEDVIIMASIVEKETAKPEERRTVAGVFANRLKRGIALQTDPTVIYAITKGEHKNDGKGPLGRRLLKKDLDYDSPYNTYKYSGLPPGPIANPGRASIEAVLNPEEHDYYYFVADGTGGHVFAKTLSDHNSNVAKWRKIRRSMN